jgi:hypothetical protein
MGKKRRPNPGSDKAIALGCTCPVLDNCHGAGYLGMKNVFVRNGGCPLHPAIKRKIPGKSVG